MAGGKKAQLVAGVGAPRVEPQAAATVPGALEDPKVAARQSERAFALGPLASPEAVPGFRSGRGELLGGLGMFLPRPNGAETTSRHAEILNPAVIAAPTGSRGVAIGRDLLSRALVAHDPFTAYQDKQIESPAVMVIGGVGQGKALDVRTPIATPNGWTTMGELEVGDVVFDERGRPTAVVAATEVMLDRECYAVDFSDGSTIIADADHQWVTTTYAQRKRDTTERHGRPLRKPRLNAKDVATLKRIAARPGPVTTTELISKLGGLPRHREAVFQTLKGVESTTARVECASERAGRVAVQVRSVRQFERGVAIAALVAQGTPRQRRGRELDTVFTTRELKDSLIANQQRNHAVALTGPLQLPAQDLPVDPYVLGMWLGDGTSTASVVTTGDAEVVTLLAERGVDVRPRGLLTYSLHLRDTPAYERTGTCGDCGTKLHRASPGVRCRACAATSTLQGKLRELGVLGNKRIPDRYLRGSESQRRDLLAGLLDSDGTVEPGGRASFTNTNYELARGVHELALSLGYRATLREGEARLNGLACGPKFTVGFTTTDPVFYLARKREALSARTTRQVPSRNAYRYVTAVRLVETRPVRCIEVAAASHQYLAGRAMIPTHNSSLLKTVYVLRPLLLKNRRCVVIDKKANGAEGEYAQLTRYFNAEPIRIATDGSGVKLNPLDPAITNPAGNADRMVGARQLRVLAEISVGRELNEWEDGALRAAYVSTLDEFSKRKGRATPTITDVTTALRNEDLIGNAAGRNEKLRDHAVRSGVGVALMLERLVATYPNIFDGETGKSVTLNDKLTTFDISSLPSEGPAADAVVGVILSWLVGRGTTGGEGAGMTTNVVLEEGWHIMRGPNARDIEAKAKLARARGMAIITAIHNPGDIPADSPGIALMKEADTVHIFQQRSAEDRQVVERLFGLDGESVGLLRDLPAGQHLLKIGGRTEILVEHIRSPIERELTDTDAAMFAGIQAGERE